MRPRHKAPQTFSLWMVDVLCCSLGAVILLWLVNAQRASSSKTKAEDLDHRILALKSEKVALEELLDRQVAELSTLSELLAALGRDKDALKAESGQRQKQADELRRDLAELKKNRGELLARLDALIKLNETLKADVKTQEDRGDTKQKRIDDLLLRLNKLNDTKDSVEKLLAQRLKEMEDLEKKLAALGKTKTTLEDDLKARAAQGALKQKRIDELAKLADELTRKLAGADETIKRLERTARLLPKLEEELKGSKEKLLDEEARRKLLQADLAKRLEEIARASKDFETLLLAKQALEKKLAGLSKEVIDALAYKEKMTQAEKKADELKDILGKKDKDLQDAIKLLARVQGDAARLKELMDRRFAGVALTGKNVVFLVDRSGSMDLLDENTPALTKWEGVRETLAKIMTSMPNLEKFQLITFGEDVTHPLGDEGRWIPYDPRTSADRVKEALAKLKPTGGTDLHKPFNAAFRMRKDGLDTVYLLSDGLPSDGEGLTPEQDRATLRDPHARSLLLSRHLRKKLKEEWNRAVPGQKQVRINSIGFFFESPDVGAFLWALSREHDGSFVGMSRP
jgi:hypothetical protein